MSNENLTRVIEWDIIKCTHFVMILFYYYVYKLAEYLQFYMALQARVVSMEGFG